jgi:hypothetical protein
MRRLAYLIALATSACASSPQPAAYAPMSTEAYFHSWYHGYYLHSVWGLGEVAAYSDEAYVFCGDQRVRVRPVFDTHIWAGHEPKAGQTQAEASAHNKMLLARFAKDGVACRVPEGDAAAPNQSFKPTPSARLNSRC